MRVLLSAYACSPNVGSEPAIGWAWARMLAGRHEVWVLTRDRNRAAIESAGGIPGATFDYVADPIVDLRRVRLLGWANHYAWQMAAYRRATGLHARVGFDLAHHVTFASWRVPSLLWRLGIPLVWGPVGGGQDIPPGFAKVLGPVGRSQESIRSVAQVLSRFDPLLRQTVAHAAVVVAANAATRALLHRLSGREVPQMLETAAPDVDLPALSTPRSAAAVTEILWVGGCLPRKALPLLLEAVATLRGRPRVRVKVVGDGPERRRWEKTAARLGVADRVLFLGRLPHAEVLSLYQASDIFAFTSIRDTSGNVLLEAMAAGLPVITLDWCGASDIVGEECGIKIPPRSPAQVVDDLAGAIERLAGDPALRGRMGAAAARRARTELTWARLAERMNVLYGRVLAPAGAGQDPLLLEPTHMLRDRGSRLP